MIPTRFLLVGCTALVLGAGTARAERLTSWYGAVEGGTNWVEDFEMQQYVLPLVAPASEGKVEEDIDFAVLAAVGYGYDDNWRVEIEGGYRSNSLQTLKPLGGVKGTADGENSHYTLMFNALYDFEAPGGVTLSVGGGVGADRVKLRSNALSPDFDGEDVALAFQAIAGMSAPIASTTDLTLNYRFLYVPKLDLQDDMIVAPSVAHVEAKDFMQHTVTLGLRIGSRGNAEPVMAEVPPPPPPPVPKQFVVFFGFNKCNITQSADTVLGEAATAARQLGSASVSIVGHTDTVGSARANLRLSTCRAQAVKSNLVGKGVAAGAITATGAGETQLLIQTGDGVKEPQNRRATVDLN